MHKLIKQYCIGKETVKKTPAKTDSKFDSADEPDKIIEEGPVAAGGSPSKKSSFANKVKFNTFVI
jgi:hypothetical protein